MSVDLFLVVEETPHVLSAMYKNVLHRLQLLQRALIYIYIGDVDIFVTEKLSVIKNNQGTFVFIFPGN